MRVCDSNESGKPLPVWKTLKGLSQRRVPDDQSPGCVGEFFRFDHVSSVANFKRNDRSKENISKTSRFYNVDKTTDNGSARCNDRFQCSDVDVSRPDFSSLPPTLNNDVLINIEPVNSCYLSPLDLNLNRASSSRSNHELSSDFDPYETPYSLNNRTDRSRKMSPNLDPCTYLYNQRLSDSSHIENPYFIDTFSSAPISRRSSCIAGFERDRLRKDRLLEQVRKNSMAVIQELSLSSTTQISNNPAAMADITHPGPECPNVFR